MGCGLDLCLNAYSSSATSLTTEGEKARAPQTRGKVNVTVENERSSTPEMRIASLYRRYASIVGKIKIKPQKSEDVMYTQTGMLSRSISFSRRGSGSPGGIFQWTSIGPSDSPTCPCDIDRDRRKCSIRTGILCESCCFCCAVRPNVPNPPVSRTDSVIARRELTLSGTNTH